MTEFMISRTYAFWHVVTSGRTMLRRGAAIGLIDMPATALPVETANIWVPSGRWSMRRTHIRDVAWQIPQGSILYKEAMAFEQVLIVLPAAIAGVWVVRCWISTVDIT